MDALLALADGLPRRDLAAGDALITDGDVGGMLFILLDGALRVEKDGVAIATIAQPGACAGELSVLLGGPSTADVVAATPATVAVVDDVPRMAAEHPELALALARVLATRVHGMTTYLADLHNQYADHEGGLGMVDVVLGALLHTPEARSELRSERDPYPEY